MNPRAETLDNTKELNIATGISNLNLPQLVAVILGSFVLNTNSVRVLRSLRERSKRNEFTARGPGRRREEEVTERITKQP